MQHAAPTQAGVIYSSYKQQWAAVMNRDACRCCTHCPLCIHRTAYFSFVTHFCSASPYSSPSPNLIPKLAWILWFLYRVLMSHLHQQFLLQYYDTWTHTTYPDPAATSHRPEPTLKNLHYLHFCCCGCCCFFLFWWPVKAPTLTVSVLVSLWTLWTAAACRWNKFSWNNFSISDISQTGKGHICGLSVLQSSLSSY